LSVRTPKKKKKPSQIKNSKKVSETTRGASGALRKKGKRVKKKGNHKKKCSKKGRKRNRSESGRKSREGKKTKKKSLEERIKRDESARTSGKRGGGGVSGVGGNARMETRGKKVQKNFVSKLKEKRLHRK